LGIALPRREAGLARRRRWRPDEPGQPDGRAPLHCPRPPLGSSRLCLGVCLCSGNSDCYLLFIVLFDDQ